jgi:hypothetical protein
MSHYHPMNVELVARLFVFIADNPVNIMQGQYDLSPYPYSRYFPAEFNRLFGFIRDGSNPVDPFILKKISSTLIHRWNVRWLGKFNISALAACLTYLTAQEQIQLLTSLETYYVRTPNKY